MQQKKQDPDRNSSGNPRLLRTPEGVGPTGPIMELEKAYAEMVGAFYEQLQNISDTLDELAGCMSIISLVAEKWSMSQGIITEADIEDERSQPESDTDTEDDE